MSKEEYSSEEKDVIADIKGHGGKSSDISYVRLELATAVSQMIEVLYRGDTRTQMQMLSRILKRYPQTFQRVERHM
tara:strand:+ start:205 stop:432 length:228 start_codon:yes stop_codon:yes gene_type:complete